MRRTLSWFSRALRDDSGLTAVEYAVLAGLVIAVCGIAAYTLGGGVRRSSGHVAWASSPSGNVHSSHITAGGSRLGLSASSASGQAPVLPWAVLSLGVTVVGIGGLFGWYYFREALRQGRTRRIVRQSLSGPEGQAALRRLVRQPSREPVARHRPVDTRLIGRNGPNVHHWVRGQQVSVSGALASAGGRPIGPETDAQIIARLRPPAATPASNPPPRPAVPVAG